LDDVELDVIALFQRFVSIQLNRRVVNEYIRPVFTSDESVALGVVKPLDLPFVLSHRLLLSSCSSFGDSVCEGNRAPISYYDEKTSRMVYLFSCQYSTK
jgi:hypothetical protein